MLSIKEVLNNKIKIKEGTITYGQYIDLNNILANKKGLSDVEIIESIFILLHDYKLKLKDFQNMEVVKYFDEICDGIAFLINRDNKQLKVHLTEEQKRAGYENLSAKIGHYGTIKALAKTYSQDPDEVLKWEYNKVFAILYTDLEEYKCASKLEEIYRAKHK